MSTDRRPQRGRTRGTVPLATAGTQRRHAVGFEHGCPGAANHLRLRFQDKPSTGIDGNPFPAALWEQSPRFTLPNQSIRLAGVGDFTTKSAFIRGLSTEASELDRGRWRTALSGHMNVTAEWFVVHDTAGGAVPTSLAGIEHNDSGVHLFLDQRRLFLHNDFHEPHTATRFEASHSEFQGKLIHVENAYTLADSVPGSDGPHPPPPRSGYNYEALALAYIFASYRARRWLTVTAHLEVDRGIPGAHHDPRGFSFARFYQTIIACMGGPRESSLGLMMQALPIPLPGLPQAVAAAAGDGLPAGSTFGILDARIGDNQNQASYANTFPAQYGPVLNKSQIVCR
jgi:hypothetical protein